MVMLYQTLMVMLYQTLIEQKQQMERSTWTEGIFARPHWQQVLLHHYRY